MHRADGVAWEVYALRYGRSAAFPLADLVAEEDAEAHQAVDWYCWALRRGGSCVLVDTGFSSRRLAQRWCIEPLLDPVGLLVHLGVLPEQVSDVVLTHGHADHTGGLGSYPRARIWLRAVEFAWIRAAMEPLRDLRWGVSLVDYETMLDAAAAGRMTLLGNHEEPLLPGVLLHPGGGHTPGSQWVQVETEGGPLVIASDNAYLFRNIEELRPIGACTSRSQNLAALRTMRIVADQDRIVPGHDPLVAERFPQVAEGVFRLG
ncbi:MAG: N-acyl homoserine lactonase family protein [Deltaproteobacteria bacterium]|nr:N-acyl homoserine lactonase family protein [Deltaproteobacteria bacterium]